MIPPATQHKLPTPLGIITLVNVSHGYYSHSYAAMQSSSRFCRKNGVCGFSTNSLRTTKPSQQTNKKTKPNSFVPETENKWEKSCHTHSRIGPSAAQLVIEGKHSEMKGSLQQVLCQLPQSVGLFSFSQTTGAQVAIPKRQNVHIIT